MEKKQGFFSALKEEVVRGLSPARSRSKSPGRSASPMSGFLRRKKVSTSNAEQLIVRSGSLRPVGETLTPLMEGPDPDAGEIGESKRVGSGLGQWESSSAQYILQQYTAACGGQKVQNAIKNAYAMGKLKMVASEFETATKVVKNRNAARAAENGGFVLWQMNPDMWYVELAVGGSKVHAGCNGKLVWRHTPWLGAHTAKGPVRPLRRALQGLDPRSTASMFADAICIGEKNINGEECFILKLAADHQTLKARSEGPAEIIRHVLFGFFSQKTGLLVHMEDSHLTRIQSNGGDAVYWETTINSYLDDYRPVEGIMIAHSGRSVVTLFRFGEMAMSHTKTRMEEVWTIERVAFNVPGLSVDCFIPPADLRSCSISEASELPQEEKGKSAMAVAANRSKVAALENTHDSGIDNVVWKVEI
ncbi:UNVERIFIED_CONTAM: hypothetical protein Sradi_1462100 [Sesamum radiatum]|uniref:Uncharacterized protein n=1 Tax=Sesamum radiatum TaxID=300843 RepID=A0AAW2U6M6_SESRA